MVLISKLTLKNFRIHENKTIELSPKTTVITGKNGSGKTSIIEAVYLSLQGSSFKGADKDILKTDKTWWRVDVTFSDGTKRQIKFNNEKITGRKQFIVDNKITQRLPQKNRIPIVLFEPNDLRLLNGSPSRRRDFIDSFICQINPEHHQIINKYKRALTQRNNLLKKSNFRKEDIFIWDVAISEYGAQIIEKRILFIEKLNNEINDLYREVAKTNDTISLHYSHTYIGDIKQRLLNDLNKNSEKDQTLGFTTVGPHRHDVIFYFNNSLALSVASRGEIRTIVIALKLLEVSLLEDVTNIKPIILLDDVFSELDEDRQKNLLTTNAQTIITSTNKPSKPRVKQETKTIHLPNTELSR